MAEVLQDFETHQPLRVLATPPPATTTALQHYSVQLATLPPATTPQDYSITALQHSVCTCISVGSGGAREGCERERAYKLQTPISFYTVAWVSKYAGALLPKWRGTRCGLGFRERAPW